MKIRNLRTGVIGVGSMGQNHARVYSEISNLVGVADPDPKQGPIIAEKFGTTWYRNYEEMLDKVDAVTISVPTSLHSTISHKVAKSGVHILVEKPLAGNSKEAQYIIDIAKNENILLAVGHIERHNPIIEFAKKNIIEQKWGELLTLSARRFSNYPSRITDVGVLFDLTIHDADVMCYLSGSQPKSVYALGGKSKNEKHEDFVNLTIQFGGGLIGLCETNWLTPMKVREISLTTTECYVNLDYLKQEVEVLSSEFGNIDSSNLYNPPMEVKKQKVSLKGEEPLKRELVDFLTSIIEERPALVTGEEGLKAVKIVEAGSLSIENSRVIQI